MSTFAPRQINVRTADKVYCDFEQYRYDIETSVQGPFESISFILMFEEKNFS